MSLLFLSTATRPCLAPLPAEFILATCRRHKSSFRRTRKALKVKPDPSFEPTKTEPQEHIVFNPPASMPNVYHTPLKFLPPNDPRRLASQELAATSEAETSAAPLPKALKMPTTYLNTPVTPEQVEEIRKLRAEDPRYWSRTRLADKFQCSPIFITLCAKSKDASDRHHSQLAAIKAKWGKKKTEAREDRDQRKLLWGRD